MARGTSFTEEYMMIRSNLTLMMAAALALAPAVLSAEEGQSTGQELQQGSATQEIRTGTSTVAGTPDDKMILADLHRTNLVEIDMASLAKDKAQSDAVRQYGDRLIQDHEAVQQQVTDLA